MCPISISLDYDGNLCWVVVETEGHSTLPFFGLAGERMSEYCSSHNNAMHQLLWLQWAPRVLSRSLYAHTLNFGKLKRRWFTLAISWDVMAQKTIGRWSSVSGNQQVIGSHAKWPSVIGRYNSFTWFRRLLWVFCLRFCCENVNRKLTTIDETMWSYSLCHWSPLVARTNDERAQML